MIDVHEYEESLSDERDILDSSHYNIEELWTIAKDLPVRSIKVSKFHLFMNEELWEDKFGQDVSPNNVLANPKIAPKHYDAILKSNLDYPIIVSRSKIDVLDGLHRLCRAILERKTVIDVQFVDASMLLNAIEKGMLTK